MLKKELCKKCKNSTDFGWVVMNDGSWWEREGEMWCPYKYIEKGESNPRKITDKPPSRCPFYLEHVI